MDAELALLPASLHDKIAVDRASRVIYVEERNQSDHLLLSWQERIRMNNALPIQILTRNLDEIAQMRVEGMRVVQSEDEVDMVVRGHAMNLICDAANYRASDLHFKLMGTYCEIQIAVNGHLRVLAQRSQEEGENLVRAIYQGIAKVRDGSYKVQEVQNAQIAGNDLLPETGITSIRIVRGPSYPESQGGSFMTLRLQYANTEAASKKRELKALESPRLPGGEFRLRKMGYTAGNMEKLEYLLDSPSGLVLFVGPTGSGKTTALYEVLREIARRKPGLRQVTIEDPVEFPMEWAVQMNVDEAADEDESGAGYREGLRTSLRMAPKLIFLGEMRGASVAEAALQASMTGHKVFSTLHVDDPFQFVERLELMDQAKLNRRVFCDPTSVRGVVAQRLLPQVCPHCSTPLNIDRISPRLATALSSWGNLNKVRLRGNGCSHCDHQGSTRRFAIVEVLVMDEALMRDFIEHGTAVARENYRARKDADPSMMGAAIRFCLGGYVDPTEIENSINLIPVKTGART